MILVIGICLLVVGVIVVNAWGGYFHDKPADTVGSIMIIVGFLGVLSSICIKLCGIMPRLK